MIRVAMLSFWHVHARDYARQAQEHPDVSIVAAWDEDAQRGRTRAEELGARFYQRLDELLAQPDIDGVIVDTPTSMHREVIVAAAQAGKHIFTEKVLAITPQECNSILDAVTRAGVKLTVSLPRLNDRYTMAVQDVLKRGLLGELTLVRTRLSHSGALCTTQQPEGWLPAHFFDRTETGGGALIDLGCHPMYLARLFLGLPESVSAHFGYLTGRAVEDNAVAVLRYPQGALGVVEAGFVNRHSPFTIEIHGTEGSLFYGTPEARLLLRNGTAQQWSEISDFPPARPSAFQQWITHIQQGTTATENIQVALDLTKLMAAATASAQQRRVVPLDIVES
jgi:1,5-anhydro-D-fructose reductase (1,5-anhydro-D-mannitol-forming)